MPIPRAQCSVASSIDSHVGSGCLPGDDHVHEVAAAETPLGGHEQGVRVDYTSFNKFLELLTQILTIPPARELECVLALDFYKVPDDEVPPEQWSDTHAGGLVNRRKYWATTNVARSSLTSLPPLLARSDDVARRPCTPRAGARSMTSANDSRAASPSGSATRTSTPSRLTRIDGRQRKDMTPGICPDTAGPMRSRAASCSSWMTSTSRASRCAALPRLRRRVRIRTCRRTHDASKVMNARDRLLRAVSLFDRHRTPRRVRDALVHDHAAGDALGALDEDQREPRV